MSTKYKKHFFLMARSLPTPHPLYGTSQYAHTAIKKEKRKKLGNFFLFVEKISTAIMLEALMALMALPLRK